MSSLAVRGSRGFCLQKEKDYTINQVGLRFLPDSPYVTHASVLAKFVFFFTFYIQGFRPDESKDVKVFKFSHDGSRLGRF